MHCITTALWTPTSAHTTATKEHIEDVHGIVETKVGPATFFQGLLTTFIVNLALLWIRQDFKCLRNFFELNTLKKLNAHYLLGAVGILIRMEL